MGGLNTFSEARPYLAQQILLVAWVSELPAPFELQSSCKGLRTSESQSSCSVRDHPPPHLPGLYFNPSCWSSVEVPPSFQRLHQMSTGDHLPPGDDGGRCETSPYRHIFAAFTWCRKSHTSLLSAHFNFATLKPPVCFAEFHRKEPCWLAWLQKPYKGLHSLLNHCMHRLQEKRTVGVRPYTKQ